MPAFLMSHNFTPGSSMRPISYSDALNEAMYQEMERDSNVFVYGIGVPDHKRIFGSTARLLERFGPDRCLETPLAEDAMTGFGLGAAVAGLRPIHVHIRSDFMLLAMNQIVNMISSFNYGAGGKLKIPMVIRAIIGRGWGQGYQHSKSLFSYFTHIPGLKVIAPTRPYDAKGLLIAAIRDDNPVIFFEHRWLYWAEGPTPEEPYTIPIGEGVVLREGSDVTVVATSWMNVEALKAAEILAKRGIGVEVLDPRTLCPLDEPLIVSSVRKTRNCVVADYDWLESGFSAEVAARVSEKCFSVLRSPVTRLGFAHTPCPTTRPLENVFYPTAETIVREIERKLKLAPMDLSGEETYTYEHRFKGPF